MFLLSSTLFCVEGRLRTGAVNQTKRGYAENGYVTTERRDLIPRESFPAERVPGGRKGGGCTPLCIIIICMFLEVEEQMVFSYVIYF